MECPACKSKEITEHVNVCLCMECMTYFAPDED